MLIDLLGEQRIEVLSDNLIDPLFESLVILEAMGDLRDEGIDWKTVDSILHVSAGRNRLMSELIVLFGESSSQNISEMKRSIARGNSNEVKAFAHAMKSVCGSIGARRAQSIAAEIENTNQSFKANEVLKFVESLENEIRQSIATLKVFVANRANPS